MEYAICQTERKNPLILSEYCGISTSLNSAVRVNPWDLTDCARQIDYCLSMSDDEKAARHSDMYQRVTTHTAAVWQAELTLMLLEARLKEEATHHTPDIDSAVALKAFTKAKKRVMFFDYDGTLTPIVKTPEAAVPSQACLDALMSLASDPRNVLYIVSGRDRAFLMQHMGHIPNLGFSAEHGCFLKMPGSDEWLNLTLGVDMSWRADVEDIFRCQSGLYMFSQLCSMLNFGWTQTTRSAPRALPWRRKQPPSLSTTAMLTLSGGTSLPFRRSTRIAQNAHWAMVLQRVPSQGMPGHSGKHAGAPGH